MDKNKLAIGTVQFGMNYGVSNKIGETHENEVGEILQYAYEQGVNMLDTAPSYGRSEGVIGEFICNHINSMCWNVVTKTPSFEGDIICNQQINELHNSFELSKKRLGQKMVYGLLLHNCNNLFLPGGDKLLQAMEELKQDGFIKKIGVSLYSGEQIDRVLDNYHIDLVQLPVNILDQRLLNSGHLKRLKNSNVEIHARSIFLQGLLLMPPKDISLWFDPIRPTLVDFHKEAKKLNMNTLQLALNFVQSISEIDKVVIGVNTQSQLHEIIKATSTYIDINKLSDFSISNPVFLNPSNWRIYSTPTN